MTTKSVTESVPSSLIAMMPVMAAGTVGDRTETGVTVPAGAIGYGIGWIEGAHGFITETTDGLTPVKSIAGTRSDFVELEVRSVS
jgi:hypothetical protein